MFVFEHKLFVFDTDGNNMNNDHSSYSITCNSGIIVVWQLYQI